MFKTLKFLFFSLLTIRHEFNYVSAALIDHKVDLPKNYWRFTLLRPFLNIECSSSALLRNFCPLFWVTNLLAILYIILSPIIAIGYPLGKMLCWLMDKREAYVLARKKRMTPVERAEEAFELKYPFTAKRVRNIFDQFSIQDIRDSCLEKFEQHLQEKKGKDFKIEDISEEQLYVLDLDFNIDHMERYALIFVFQNRHNWETKYREFQEQAKVVHVTKTEKKAKKVADWEARFAKILPGLIRTSKNIGLVLGLIAVVTIFVLAGWALYLWFIPAVKIAIGALIGIFDYLTSVDFLMVILWIFGMFVAAVATYYIILIPMAMFQDKIIDICENYYANNPRAQKSGNIREIGALALEKSSYNSAFIWLFLFKLLDILTDCTMFVVSIVTWPWMFVKMFYAKNCPSINVTDTDTNDADSHTEQPNT